MTQNSKNRLDLRHQKVNFFWKKTLYSDVRQSKTKKILSSIFAVFCSLVIAIILACSVCKAWPKVGTVIKTIFTSGYKKSFLNTLFSNTAIMIVAGLAFIFAYKAGLFNIGISGQMVFGGTLATLICHKCHIASGGNQIVILLVSVLGAAAIAAIVGALKAFLNVNEVVSSIMFNWIIYYMSILILSGSKVATDSSGLATLAPADNMLFRIGPNSYGPLLIMALLLVVIVAVIINYTVFGRKLKVTGLTRTGALASGYNVKANLVLSMAISGAIAGVLGVMVYAGFNPQMPVTAAAKAIPQEGFNGISVGLIAMCSPVASIPVSLFFSMVQTSVSDLQVVGIDNHIAQVVFGIVVYGAAAIALFLNLKPYWLTLKIFRGKKYSKIKHEENVANIALIEYASDYNAQLKKYYYYSKKQQRIKCSFALSPMQKIKCFFANIRYHLVKFGAKCAVQRNSRICFINHKKYLRQEMVHLVIKNGEIKVDPEHKGHGGFWFKPTEEIINDKNFAVIIEQVVEKIPSVEVMNEIVIASKDLIANPFDSNELRKIPKLGYIQNLRTGLSYRYDIAKQNVLDRESLAAVMKLEDELGLPLIKSKRDYKIAYAAHVRAYNLAAAEITNFYQKAYKEYAPNKKIGKISIMDPLDVKYNLSFMEKSYEMHLRKEIRKIRDEIDKPMFIYENDMIANENVAKEGE